MRRRKCILLIGCFVASLTGCELQRIANMPGIQIPVHDQSKPVTMFNPIELSITKCYWADEFEKAGFQSVPESVRDQQRNLFVAKPKSRFLVIEFAAVNTGKSPAAWPHLYPPIFTLENSTSATYGEENDQINHDRLMNPIVMRQANINPGGALKGKALFDVPNETYLLNVSLPSQVQGWTFSANRVSFKWRLSPTEKGGNL